MITAIIPGSIVVHAVLFLFAEPSAPLSPAAFRSSLMHVSLVQHKSKYVTSSICLVRAPGLLQQLTLQAVSRNPVGIEALWYWR